MQDRICRSDENPTRGRTIHSGQRLLLQRRPAVALSLQGFKSRDNLRVITQARQKRPSRHRSCYQSMGTMGGFSR